MASRRRSAPGRWLLVLLLLAFLAWGVGQLRSERGAKPELGVGDLRLEAMEAAAPAEDGDGAPPAADPRLPATLPAAPPATGEAGTGEARTGDR